MGDVYYHLGVALQVLHQETEADQAFEHALAEAADEHARNVRRLEISIQALAAGRYSAAEFSLLRVSTFTDDPALQRRAQLFLGVCYLYTFRWDEAAQALRAYFPATPTPAQARVLDLLAPAHRPRYKSPHTARLLSSILPGAGQAYVGAPWPAVDALGLNLLTGSTVLGPLLARDPVSATLNFLGLFRRYYDGNRYHAAQLADDRNNLLDRRYLAQVLAILPAAAEDKP